jgi:hypothetical protein
MTRAAKPCPNPPCGTYGEPVQDGNRWIVERFTCDGAVHAVGDSPASALTAARRSKSGCHADGCD